MMLQCNQQRRGYEPAEMVSRTHTQMIMSRLQGEFFLEDSIFTETM